MKIEAHPLRALTSISSSTSPHPQHLRNYRNAPRHVTPVLSLHHNRLPEQAHPPAATRRHVLLVPFLATVGAAVLRSSPSRAEEAKSPPPSPGSSPPPSIPPPAPVVEEISSRIYDATVIGEPMAVGKDKRKVWEKLTSARIVYLGEAEQVPTRDDNVLELEIVRSLRRRCDESERSLSLALEAFPCDSQAQLNQYMDRKSDGEALKSYVSRWQEYEPLLNYCRENGVKVVACGTPLQVLRTVQAEGIRGLSKAERKLYAPPAGSGFISGFSISSRSVDFNSPNPSVPFGPSSFLSAQARVVEDYTMSQIILQAVTDGGANGMLVVVTGASHIMFGARGTGVPARISRKMQKRNQVVILLNPERQFIRREGEVPDADFFWYSAARPCSRNCYDRAEIARVMNAAGRRREALPQDLQQGLDLGLVSPEVLQNFFDLEQYPLVKELTHRFQGFRERLLADPKFLNRLAIEESISVTTTLLAQYQKRKENFFEEIDYVITDTARGIVVDFFTVWLPAPTLSFLSYANDSSSADSLDILKGLLGSIPDNAFQKSLAGRDWNLSHRLASVLIGGLKLFGVGFISSIGAVAASNTLYTVRKFVNPELVTAQQTRRSPLLKTAFIYSSFLGISANLRYQVIFVFTCYYKGEPSALFDLNKLLTRSGKAYTKGNLCLQEYIPMGVPDIHKIIAGVIEHRISDAFSSQILLVNMLSFVARTVNSYWGTQQWIDLARYSGLQSRNTDTPKTETPVYENPDSPGSAALECNTTEDASGDEPKNQ